MFVKLALLWLVACAAMAAAKVNFDTNFVELDSNKMVSTGDKNYAIISQNFPSNWRSVSINGDEVTIATRDNQAIFKSFSSLTQDEKNSLETMKTSMTAVIRLGPFNVKSQTGTAKLTTFDRFGTSSTMGTGGGSSASSSSASSSSAGGISVSRTGPNSYIVSKQDFPFGWHRVFVNEDVTAVVYKNGRVVMLPQDLFRQDEKLKLIDLRKEVDQSTKSIEKMTQSMQNFGNPMDFVNKAFGGIFGR